MRSNTKKFIKSEMQLCQFFIMFDVELRGGYAKLKFNLLNFTEIEST